MVKTLACLSRFSHRLARSLPQLLPTSFKTFEDGVESVDHRPIARFGSTVSDNSVFLRQLFFSVVSASH